MSIRDNYMMSIDTPYYDIDKDISVKIFVQDRTFCYVSIYNDRTDKSVAFQTSRDKLKGLADFINKFLEVQ